MNRTVVVIVLVVLGLGVLFLALRPDSTSTKDDDPTETPADEPQERDYDVAIEGGAMEPAEINAEERDFVTLRLTSESPVEVHVHGYDVEGDVLPGEETELSFEADATGRFEIEDHETEAQLGTLLVQPR
ncbi:MAG: cupredoxin domain-containing protein [Actinobacteria bacterium]|nr:cupredoxin domain-containing protein [Actinomycetota bacterium]